MFTNYHILYIFFFLFIDNFYPFIDNIYVIPFVHALITGLYSNYLLYLNSNEYFNISLYDVNEIHPYYNSIPIYTYIYLYFHVKSAIKKSNAEVVHAFMISLMCFICIYYKKNHYFIPGLIIESSTIFLKLMDAYKSIFFKFLFIITFTIYRGFIFPFICYRFINNHYYEISSIYDIHFIYFLILMLSNGLNLYWLKIIFYKLYKLVIKTD